MLHVRLATVDDLPLVVAIQNALLGTTTYEWRDEPHTIEARRVWLDSGVTVFVGEDDGHVVGWASYGDFRDTAKWPGYAITVENTIHIDQAAWGRGVGRRLMEALMRHAAGAGKLVMVAAVDGSNEPSIAFHRKLGFVETARMPGLGVKHGRRLDLVMLQRDLSGLPE